MLLLDLPDEILAQIILEALWATTTRPSHPPDLCGYERRLTNHPSREPTKVAYLGQICHRLREIASPHLRPKQLWGDLTSSRAATGPDLVPQKLLSDEIEALVLADEQCRSLPTFAGATLKQLKDLHWQINITEDDFDYDDDDPRYPQSVISDFRAALAKCERLETLHLQPLAFFLEERTSTPWQSIAGLQALRHLSMSRFYYPDATQAILEMEWQAPLVRLEIAYSAGVTVEWFTELLCKFAPTIEVAIFKYNINYETLLSAASPSRAAVNDVAFRRLWRLEFTCEPPIRMGRPSVMQIRRPEREHLPGNAPIAIFKAAPQLSHFRCSEPLAAKTAKELEEVAALTRRDGVECVRILLTTWDGQKGRRWTRDVRQEIRIGRVDVEDKPWPAPSNE